MSNPKRIQLSRKKGWRLPPNTVIVSRPSKFGNPYRIDEMESGALSKQQMAVIKFSQMVEQNRDYQLEAKRLLRGKNLACWCKAGEACHADVLIQVANS